MHRFRSALHSGALLVFFQILGMAIPLLTLPFVARALGVDEFGKVMLAQAIVFFGVVFIDAGFNTESQRRVALASDQTQSLQVLFDNLKARSACAIPTMAVIIGLSFLFEDVPLTYVLVALLHVMGTLAFPQWWLIGKSLGFQMGLASTAGRLIAAVLTLWWVRTPGDGMWAVAAASSGTVWAGLLVTPLIRRHWKLAAGQMDPRSWRSYFAAVRPTIFSGFFASASASTPAVLLGWVSGAAQVGVFSAADRLTRAAAHLMGVIEQTLMGQLARAEQNDTALGKTLRRDLMIRLGLASALGCLVVGVWADLVVRLLYGDKFATVSPVLQLLCVWLWIHVMRRAGLLFTWSLRGNLKGVSRFQWLEAGVVTTMAALGATGAGALGLSSGLVAAEVVLGLALWFALGREGKQK
ncbi:MAG: hypothetical protein RLZZ126_832 [Pseudomonadota bacterium]|jgi:PST family polysaccharide transporter/O-antigen flippase